MCVRQFDDSLNSAIHNTLSRFATVFIDARAKGSTVGSCTTTIMGSPLNRYILHRSDYKGNVKRLGKLPVAVCLDKGRQPRPCLGRGLPHRWDGAGAQDETHGGKLPVAQRERSATPPAMP